MKYLVRFVVVFGMGIGVYFWLNTEVPGGEKRYEQLVRQFRDRHPVNGI